jgi:hypothetical protein
MITVTKNDKLVKGFGKVKQTDKPKYHGLVHSYEMWL